LKKTPLEYSGDNKGDYPRSGGFFGALKRKFSELPLFELDTEKKIKI
jgi:hypothetical protein